MYTVYLDEKVQKKILSFDKSVRRLLSQYIKKNLLGTDDPRIHGKPLNKALKGFWRYRIMDYRLLVKIHDDELTIIAVDFDHRSKIYKKFLKNEPGA